MEQIELDLWTNSIVEAKQTLDEPCWKAQIGREWTLYGSEVNRTITATSRICSLKSCSTTTSYVNNVPP